MLLAQDGETGTAAQTFSDARPLVRSMPARLLYQVDKARSRELGGTGLGLSIVKHLVQSIGGQLEVTSRLDSGSNFTVLFPRGRPAGATQGAGRPGGLDGRGR